MSERMGAGARESVDRATAMETRPSPRTPQSGQAGAATTAPPPLAAVSIPIEDIQLSRTNPRRSRSTEADADLVESVRQHGVLQPVLVRPAPKPTKPQPDPVRKYELVAGSRRYAAARAAGLVEIPATIREMSDLEAIEVQIIENLQRADVHPLEEAEAYQQMHQGHGYTVEDLAAKVAKSKAYVYGRLRLASLHPKLKKAYLDERFNVGVAFLLARLPDQDVALKAFETAVSWSRGDRGDAIDLREVRRAIEHNVLQDLREAPFDTADATLVPAAGSCVACPKRTGNSPDLFGDVKAVNTCTDPRCYLGKREAAWARRKREAQAEGLTVLDDKASEKALRYGSKYVDLDDVNYDLGEGNKKNRTLLKVAGKELKPVVARDPRTGEVKELVLREHLVSAIGKRSRRSAGPSRDSYEAKRKRELERGRVRMAAMVAAVRDAALKANVEQLWELTAAFAFSRSLSDVCGAVAKSVGAERQKKRTSYGMALESPGEALVRWVQEQPKAEQPSARKRVVLELMLTGTLYAHQSPESNGPLQAAGRLFRVDLKKVGDRAVAALHETRVARKSKPAATPAAGARKAKPGSRPKPASGGRRAGP